MAVQHRREGSIAVVVAEGHYEVAELRAAMEGALASFDDAGASGLLFDLSASQALGDRPTEDVRAMAYFIAARGDRFARRIAMVTASEVAYGLMRLGSVVVESQGVAARVFRDYRSAMTWLASESG